MSGKRFVLALALALLVLPASARADVLLPWQSPPRNRQSEAFVKLYADQIVAWDSAYENALAGVEEIVLWKYPGSGERKGIINADWFGGPKGGPGKRFETGYVDAEGRFWVYVDYAYGRRLAWACISDPDNYYLPKDMEVRASVTRETWRETWQGSGSAIALVSGLTAFTGGLLYLLWRQTERGKF